MKKFAVFDIDGTLVRWQLYHVVVDRLAKQGALGEDAYEKISDARMKWKRREDANGFGNYEQLLIESYESALVTIRPEAFDSLVLDIIDEYKNQVYTYTRDLIKELKDEGYYLLAISGSHHELVEQIALYYKFDDYIGSDHKREKGKFTGETYIPSKNKAEALKDLIEKHKLDLSKSVAVGDSFSDVAMLELVENPIAFNPDKRLFEHATKFGWDIVVERKNMIYQLRHENDSYKLRK